MTEYSKINQQLGLEQQYAFEKFKQKHNLFITGPGGTGKTKLIEHLVNHSKSEGHAVQVCAMTGCATILLNNNARTLHSWSGIKLAKGSKHMVVGNVLKNRAACAAWRKVKVLIIDEVSMMSMKIFEILEEVARLVRKNSQPFGNIQVIFTGDFYQLPPVGNSGEPETEMFCFESPVWTRVFPKANHVELRTIFRQTDPKYKEILLQIRTATLTEENKQILQGYVKREFDPAQHNGCIPTKLFPTRAKTDYLNNAMFNRLEGQEYVFNCDKKTSCRTILETNAALSLEQMARSAHLSGQEVDYEVQQLMSNSSFQEVMSLKVGAAVMCTVNLDMDNGICNGSQGVVVDILTPGSNKVVSDKNTANTYLGPCPVVRFTNGLVKTIVPHYRQSEEYPSIAVGQIPLCLAWALTIHKIQGATLAMADIDVGGQIFEFGQTYVALSRVQSLTGLYLSAFHAQKIKANERVTAFYRIMMGDQIDYSVELHKMTDNPFSSFALSAEQSGSELTVEEPITNLPIQNTMAKKELAKTGKEPTDKISLALFIEGKSIDEIATIRGLKPNTIFEHIVSNMPHPQISADRLMTQDEFNEIKAVFDVSGNTSLNMVKENVSSRITYNHIKVVQRVMYGTASVDARTASVDTGPVVKNTTKIIRL